MSYILAREKNKLAAAAILLSMVKKPDLPTKRIWCKSFILRSGRDGHFENVYNEWRYHDPEEFRRQLRLTPECYKILLDLVRPDIEKKDTILRYSIPADKRLACTLKFLATGASFSNLAGEFCMGKSTVGEIVIETCRAIATKLAFVLKTPSTPDEWMEIANKNWLKWDYPNCIGALDGSHILIQPPASSGSYYFNYKGENSIVLMALVGPDKEFLYANVGMNGRVSDGGVWARCDLRDSLESNSLNLPEPKNLPGTNDKIPFHIVADAAFPLGMNLMKPFPKAQECNNIPNRIYNLRLSRCRITSENCFGILTKIFEVFRAPMRISPEKAEVVVYAAMTLHNWLITMQNRGITHGYIDQNSPDKLIGDGIVPLVEQVGLVPTNSTQVRFKVRNFVNAQGFRHWQLDKI